MNSNDLDHDSSSAMCITCTKAAAILPHFSGGISAISSSLIIYIIFRSSDKLKTIYHRIMFGLSVSNILSSIALGLSTLLLPKDELPFEYPSFYGTRLGNAQICETQGFLILFGFTAGLGYYASLFIYNTCAIVFMMQEKNIVRYVEPIVFHLFPLASGLSASIIPLVYKLYKPTKRNPFCVITPDEQNSNSERIYRLLTLSWSIRCLIKFAAIIICSIMIMRKVARLEHALSRDIIRVHSRNKNVVNRSLKNAKVVLVHALAFVLAFILSFGAVAIRYATGDVHVWLANLSFILMPLQGFFNFLIFIIHKVYNYRRVHRDVSRLDVIRMLLDGAEEEPVLFSRISLVQRHDERNMNVQISDENGNNRFIQIQLGDNSPSQISSAHPQFDDESKQSEDLSGFPLSIDPSSNDEMSSQSNYIDSIFSQGDTCTSSRQQCLNDKECLDHL